MPRVMFWMFLLYIDHILCSVLILDQPDSIQVLLNVDACEIRHCHTENNASMRLNKAFYHIHIDSSKDHNIFDYGLMFH